MGCLNFPMKAEVGSYKSGGTASERTDVQQSGAQRQTGS